MFSEDAYCNISHVGTIVKSDTGEQNKHKSDACVPVIGTKGEGVHFTMSVLRKFNVSW